jgi:hypothetical protein
MNIHIIGDSHTIMYKSLEPEIKSIHMGACTAYSLMTEHSFTNSYTTIRKFISGLDNKKDMIIFLFGEIDCRVLIYFKHIKHNIGSIQDMIDIVAYRYLSALLYVAYLGFNIAVHGPIPAVRQGNDYGLEHYADEKTRAWISTNFNITLKNLCEIIGIPYFNSHSLSYLKGEDGLVPVESMLPDLVHIDPTKVPIVEDFKKWLKELNTLFDLRGMTTWISN